MDSRKRVEEMIKNYPDNLALMKSLEEESRSFVPVTESEVLDALNFPGRREETVRVQKSVCTTQVMQVAMSYRKLTWLMNQSVRQEIAREYLKLSREVEFIRYAIRALPRFYRELMTFSVLEDKSWGEVCQYFSISGSEFSRKRDRAVERMTRTFEQQYHYFGLENVDD